MTIGERILNVIKEKGMTQKEFSLKTGIPQSTLSSWKSRRQIPGMDKVQIICDTLNIDPYYVISGTEYDGTEKTDYLILDKNAKEYELVVEYRKLDDHSRDRLLGYLQALRNLK